MARKTIQQDIIYDAVINMRNHPSPDDVYEAVHKNYPSIGRATVYRVLKRLAESGKIRKVQLPDCADRFDYRTEEHIHIHCTVCNKVFDMESEVSDNIFSEINDMLRQNSTSLDKFKISNLNISFEGICPECMKNKGGIS